MFAGIFIYFFFYILICTKRSPITSTIFFTPFSHSEGNSFGILIIEQ